MELRTRGENFFKSWRRKCSFAYVSYSSKDYCDFQRFLNKPETRDVLAKMREISQNVGFPEQLRDGWHHINRMSFSSDQVTATVSSSEHAFPSKFWIYFEHCPRGEAVIIGHLRLSSMRQPATLKQLSFRPLLLLLLLLPSLAGAHVRICGK